MVRAVVFDIGNVFLPWHPHAYYAQFFGADRTDEFFKSVPIEAANAACDAGARFPDVILDLVPQFPQWQGEIEFWVQHWIHMIAPPNLETVAIFQELRQLGVPCFALSNFGKETWDIAAAEFEFLTWFDDVVVSGQIGLTKPDPAIYAHLEQKLALTGDQIFFTDDMEANIITAQARGWQAHQFKDAGTLREQLVMCGVLGRRE